MARAVDIQANLVTGPANGTLSFNPDGSFVYTPNANFYGTDSFTYVATNGTYNSSPATVTLNVLPQPCPGLPPELETCCPTRSPKIGGLSML